MVEFETRFSLLKEAQTSPMTRGDVGVASANLSVKLYEDFEVAGEDDDSVDFMHLVEDEFFLPEACDQMLMH